MRRGEQMYLAAALVGLIWLCFLQISANAQSNADALWFQPGATITKVREIYPIYLQYILTSL